MDNMPAFIYNNYRELAELAAFRLSGYAEMKACNATNAQILELEKEMGNGEVNWSEKAQPAIVAGVVGKLLQSFMQ